MEKQFDFKIPILSDQEIHTAKWSVKKEVYIIDNDDILLYSKEEVKEALSSNRWIKVNYHSN